ncbi:MAG UNVERIFIED_CONTAM: hypothetical protein LVR29_05045 [Microcystis novacekii LVE1205-3]
MVGAYSVHPFSTRFAYHHNLKRAKGIGQLSIFITTASQSLVTNIPKVTEKG